MQSPGGFDFQRAALSCLCLAAVPALTHSLSGRCPGVCAALLPGKAGKESQAGWLPASLAWLAWHSWAPARAFSTCQGCCTAPTVYFGKWEFIHLALLEASLKYDLNNHFVEKELL